MITIKTTLEVIHGRASLRIYQDSPISDEHLNAVLEAALRAPTAGNMMLYTVLVIRDPLTKKRLSQTCDNQPFIAGAPLVLVFLADFQRWFDYYKLSGVAHLRKPDLGELFLAVNDALISAQTAVLAAESLGIGSCYIGDIMENQEIHRELLRLPDYAFPAAMLCFGYYPEGHRPKLQPRFSPEHIIHQEHYHRLDSEDLRKMFFAQEQGFSPANKFGAENLGQFVYARKTGADFSSEMNRSLRVALKQWSGGPAQ